MRKIIRLILLGITGIYFIASLAYAIFWSRSNIGETFSLTLHVSVFILGWLVLLFIGPYDKWISNKFGRFENFVLIALFILGIISWLLGAVGVSWATVELFFSFLWATFYLSMFIALKNLSKVKKFNDESKNNNMNDTMDTHQKDLLNRK